MTKQHIRSLLFTFLFAAATISLALHELSPHHHADNCPVCVVDEHSLSADIISDVTEEKLVLFYAHYSFAVNQKRVELLTTLNARAPPLLFS
jgi:hypothetical protein